MRRALLVLLLALPVLGAVVWLASLRGSVVYSNGDVSVRAAASTALLALLFVVLLAVMLLRVLEGLWRLPRRLWAARALRRQAEGDAAIGRALVSLAAGHQSEAVDQAARARKLLGDVPHVLKLSAEADLAAARPEKAAAHYEALAARPDSALVGLRGLIDQAMARGDWDTAGQLATKARAAMPGAAWLSQLDHALASRRGDWSGALALAGPAAPRVALATAAAASATDPAEALRLAKDAFRADPAFAPAALVYAERLRAAHEPRKALAVLEENWKAAPYPEVAEAALAGVEGAAARLTAARRLVRDNPDHPESRLVLARAALDANELAEARELADKLRPLNQHRVWALVAEVENRISPESQAVRAAWQKLATARPDPRWRCEACRADAAAWSARCARCGETFTLTWAETA